MLHALLADFTPLSPGAQLAIISLLSVAVLVLTLRGLIKRTPPLDTELVTLRISIQSLEKTVGNLVEEQRKHANHETQITSLRDQVRELRQKQESDAGTHRRHVGHVVDNISTEIKTLTASMSANLGKIEGALGRLDGTLEGIDKRLSRVENEG